MNKKLLIGAGAVALVVAVAAYLWLGGSAGDGSADGAAARQKGRIADVGSSSSTNAKPERPKRIADARKTAKSNAASADEADDGESAAHELSAEDEKLVESIQAALDDENIAEVRKLTESLVNHPEAEVRQRAVEALQWFGSKSLDALTPFLADSNEDVKSSALDAVEMALSDMDDESAKLSYIESVFQIKDACSDDALTMLAGQTKGFEDSAAVVDAAVRIISANSNPAAVREMKEVYEFVTGEPYTTPDAAQQWRAANTEVVEVAE